MNRGSRFALNQEHHELKRLILQREKELDELMNETKGNIDGHNVRLAKFTKKDSFSSDTESDGAEQGVQKMRVPRRVIKNQGSCEDVELDLSLLKAGMNK